MPNTFPVATVTEGPGAVGFMPSGVFCVAALADADGKFLFLSLLGRDTALQEMRGKLTGHQLNSLVATAGNKTVSSGWFDRESLGTLQYHGAKVQTALFGEVSQAIFYQPILTTPDKASMKAIVPFMGDDVRDEDKALAAWQVLKAISPIPLMDEWQHVVMTLLAALEWVTALEGFGGVSAISVDIGGQRDMGGLVTANIRSGALRIEPDAQGRLAAPELATFDADYPNPYAKPVGPEAPALPNPETEKPQEDDYWGAPISVHTRQMLIDDGDLVDVTDTSECREAGFRVPVALTRAAYGRFVGWDNGEVSPRQRGLGQSTAGRLWDVLYMAAHAARNRAQGRAAAGHEGFMLYELYAIERDGKSTTARSQKLKLHSGPGDRGEHVMTIMLPGED